jgi:hypothetical protein
MAAEKEDRKATLRKYSTHASNYIITWKRNKKTQRDVGELRWLHCKREKFKSRDFPEVNKHVL